ncbi:GNAT family N-acetyltransferase [Candidatus Fermentibacteria bacterium]|nr:GNAT family N-acetyltransferase [Candidatus Fermentibacteria bacterium]
MATEDRDSSGTRIFAADTSERLEDARLLFLEYESYLGLDLSFQDFDREVRNLPGEYGPPGGAILIAYPKGRAAGCVALKSLGEGICEMKRLYVRPEYRGMGLGRALSESIIRRARRMGYSRMRLDTLSSLREAMGLYESMGFQRVEPYYDNPLPDVVYWELDLVKPEKDSEH